MTHRYTMYLSACYYILHICPHTTIHYMCPHATTFHIRVLVLPLIASALPAALPLPLAPLLRYDYMGELTKREQLGLALR